MVNSVDTGEILAEPPRPTPSAEERSTSLVDRELPDLAGLCAAWAHRGRVLEELVGIVYGCPCHSKVMPRDELPRRLERGPLLDALMETRTARDRLPVVVATHKGIFTHHVAVPEVAVPDTRGLLGPLSAKRQGLLDERIEEWGPHMIVELRNRLLDESTIDGIYVRVIGLELGGGAWPYKNCSDGAHGSAGLIGPRMAAARLEAQPNKLLFLVEKVFTGDADAAAWIDPRRLGLHEAPCWMRPGDEHP